MDEMTLPIGVHSYDQGIPANLVNAIIELKSGKTRESLIATGYDKETIEAAVRCVM